MATNSETLIGPNLCPSIRKMAEEDLNSVVINENKSYEFPWTRGVFNDCLGRDYECWVVCFDKKIIGHAIFSEAANEAHLLNLCIEPEFQGRGFGRKLVHHVLSIARSFAVTLVFLEVRISNLAANQLYESIGFSQIGVRKSYYPAKIGYEDAKVLAIDVSQYFASDNVYLAWN
ncbi:MAG: ribosomal-protein-alanine N-acetyltransferase [Gammaproteobacteria bacterium]|nr:ribosomal-protein-alanine N-acetyltransferase [Gammaproteobacteria bacterium]